jgi:hypothetical protein
MMKILSGVALLSLLLIQQAYAWGPEGHSIVAQIAQRRLTPQAAEAIGRILNPTNDRPAYTLPSFDSFASWADDVRDPKGPHPESFNWHFVDIPLGPPGTENAFDAGRDCQNGDCVVGELARLRNELRCEKGEKQLEALKFAVHFVGDAHQPFHTVLEAQGGNLVSVHVLFGGKICETMTCLIHDEWQNLHAVWDSTLINKTVFDWGAYVDSLEAGWLTSPAAKNDHKDDPVEWVNDAHVLAKQFWVSDGSSLFPDYYKNASKVVDQQLALAGLRLARYLNDVFSSTECPVDSPAAR